MAFIIISFVLFLENHYLAYIYFVKIYNGYYVMKKIFFIFFILFLVATASRCSMEEGWGNPFITIVNRSDKSIEFIMGEHYPDTVFQFGHSISVGPNDQRDYTYYLSRTKLFKKYPIMQVFAIDIENTTLAIDTIRKYHLYERYELTKKQLEENNWIVVYPKE